MKTLVIHPDDITTGFLEVIYEGTDWTVISSPISSKKDIKSAIIAHDIIIMLGHGTENGLISTCRNMIDSSMVYLLRDKIGIYIWCNADQFVERYKLTGFYTGMIVSEVEEAIMFCVNSTYDEIQHSNRLFADSVKESIKNGNALDTMKRLYTGNSAVIKFNSKNIHNNSKMFL